MIRMIPDGRQKVNIGLPVAQVIQDYVGDLVVCQVFNDLLIVFRIGEGTGISIGIKIK